MTTLWARPPDEGYRGRDRRAPASPPASPRLPLVIGGGVSAVLLLAFALLVVVDGWDAPQVLNRVDGELAAAASAVAFVAAVLSVIRWRAAGDAPSLWTAAGLAALGVAAIAVPPAAGGWEAVAAVVRAAGLLVAAALLQLASRSHPVDTRWGVGHAAVLAGGGFALLTASGMGIVGVVEGRLAVGASVWLTAGFAAGTGLLLFVVSVVVGARARARGQIFLLWCAVGTGALALGEGMTLVGASTGGSWSGGQALLQLAGVALAFAGSIEGLRGAFAQQSSRLLETTVERLATEARMKAEQATFDRRAHAARNAMTAIEGATLTLERFRDALDAETRRTLSTAVSQEVARLQGLVGPDGRLSDRVDLGEVWKTVVAALDPGIGPVDADLGRELAVRGSLADVANVLIAVIDAAHELSGGSPLTVETRAAAEVVELSVGPLPPAAPPRGGGAGRRALARARSLDLEVATAVAREIGGRLEDRVERHGRRQLVLQLPR